MRVNACAQPVPSLPSTLPRLPAGRQAYARIREAATSAQEAAMARDTATSRQADMERQLELANTRLATVGRGWAAAAGRTTEPAYVGTYLCLPTLPAGACMYIMR